MSDYDDEAMQRADIPPLERDRRVMLAILRQWLGYCASTACADVLQEAGFRRASAESKPTAPGGVTITDAMVAVAVRTFNTHPFPIPRPGQVLTGEHMQHESMRAAIRAAIEATSPLTELLIEAAERLSPSSGMIAMSGGSDQLSRDRDLARRLREAAGR